MLHPNRIDIPTTYHINSLVSSYRRVLKENGKADNDDEEDDEIGTSKVQYRMPLRYVQCLDSIAHGNPNISEVVVRRAMMASLDINQEQVPEDFPSTDQI